MSTLSHKMYPHTIVKLRVNDGAENKKIWQKNKIARPKRIVNDKKHDNEDEE